MNDKKKYLFGSAKRIGIKSEVTKDYYYLLMRANWPSTLLIFATFYSSLNLMFAAIYYFTPESISPMTSFADAFYFSIQTFATIGYGVITPKSHLGNIVVSIESFTGMMSMAVMTGLIFAKIAKPRSKILFSKNAVIHKMDGEDVFSFRMGNTRGNDIIDANCSVFVLVDSQTKEGQHIRRVHDLKLVRSRSPFFILSWQVIHIIDDTSPIKPLVSDQAHNVLTISCVVTGHDGTYSQTIYNRHTYEFESIKKNHVFEDIIENHSDGKITIDYSKIDKIIPQSI